MGFLWCPRWDVIFSLRENIPAGRRLGKESELSFRSSSTAFEPYGFCVPSMNTNNYTELKLGIIVGARDGT